MAKIIEQLAVIKVSKLAKDSDKDDLNAITEEITQQLQEVLETLLGEGTVIEVDVQND